VVVVLFEANALSRRRDDDDREGEEFYVYSMILYYRGTSTKVPGAMHTQEGVLGEKVEQMF
jgi:hypothetical protein